MLSLYEIDVIKDSQSVTSMNVIEILYCTLRIMVMSRVEVKDNRNQFM